MNRELENQFFGAFSDKGAAIITLEMMLYEHCGIGGWLPARADYPDGVLAEIKAKTEQQEVWPWRREENYCPLFDEIRDNLDSYNSDDKRDNYVIEVLRKFQKWTWLYSLSKGKLDAISNTTTLYSLEYYFFDWRSAFQSFAENFAVALAERGVNILELQNRCGISIIDRLDVDDLWINFGTPQLAEYHLSRLKPIDTAPTLPIDLNTSESQNLPKEFVTGEARIMFESLEKLGYCKKFGMIYQWTGTAALFGYFVMKTSEKLGIRHDNNRLPWGIYSCAFSMRDAKVRTAKNFVSRYSSKMVSEPKGYDDINRLCR